MSASATHAPPPGGGGGNVEPPSGAGAGVVSLGVLGLLPLFVFDGFVGLVELVGSFLSPSF
jgi:hypothetical protein